MACADDGLSESIATPLAAHAVDRESPRTNAFLIGAPKPAPKNPNSTRLKPADDPGILGTGPIGENKYKL